MSKYTRPRRSANFVKKLSRNQKITIVISIAGIVIMALLTIGGWIFERGPTFAPQTASDVSGNLTQVQAGGDVFVTNENKQITLPLQFEFGIENIRTVGKILRAVEFILPNEKRAFVPELKRGQKYTLFYTNKDLSELYVPESYRILPDDSQICWKVIISCDPNVSCGNDMVSGPRVSDPYCWKE